MDEVSFVTSQLERKCGSACSPPAHRHLNGANNPTILRQIHEGLFAVRFLRQRKPEILMDGNEHIYYGIYIDARIGGQRIIHRTLMV